MSLRSRAGPGAAVVLALLALAAGEATRARPPLAPTRGRASVLPLPPAMLLAAARTPHGRFHGQAPGASVEFELDDAGAPLALRLEHGGRSFQAGPGAARPSPVPGARTAALSVSVPEGGTERPLELRLAWIPLAKGRIRIALELREARSGALARWLGRERPAIVYSGDLELEAVDG